MSAYRFADIVDPDTGTSITALCCVFSAAAGPNGSAEMGWTTTSGTKSGDVWVASTLRRRGHPSPLVRREHPQVRSGLRGRRGGIS
ncbi:MAG TPA: hypothetical protein VEQ37_09330 [Actinomycetota bacterium]|nr:hypothetical protein [Actinomycetota bacterium]